MALHENKDGVDEYGNSGFCTQSVSKEARERDERGPIIGNWKEVGSKQKPSASSQRTQAPKAAEPDDEDCPF